MKPDTDMTTTALVGWYGAARMIAESVGRALDGCSHVTIPFMGGLSEVPWIGARSIVAADLHRHLVNLAPGRRRSSPRAEAVPRCSAATPA